MIIWLYGKWLQKDTKIIIACVLHDNHTGYGKGPHKIDDVRASQVAGCVVRHTTVIKVEKALALSRHL